jgi:hypothetical protein
LKKTIALWIEGTWFEMSTAPELTQNAVHEHSEKKTFSAILPVRVNSPTAAMFHFD